jgi:hypothetical protein
VSSLPFLFVVSVETCIYRCSVMILQVPRVCDRLDFCAIADSITHGFVRRRELRAQKAGACLFFLSPSCACSTAEIQNKRRKFTIRTIEPSPTEAESTPSAPFAPLLDLVNQSCPQDVDSAFDDLIEDLLPEFLQERFDLQGREAEVDSLVCFRRGQSICYSDSANLGTEISTIDTP